MSTPAEGNARLAVLIDADNAEASIIDPLLAEISTMGVASVKRIYGDWTDNRLNKWKDTLLAHSIQPIQQFAYTTGKNATDSAMIIDAMDLLYTDTFDGFCLVSSDSDFTRLASRLREAGTHVTGFGRETTPRAFITACDRFIRTEIYKTRPGSGGAGSTRKTTADLKSDTDLVQNFRSAIDAASGDDGWAPLGQVGQILLKQNPDFDPRGYGYAKLSGLVEAIGLFTVERSSGRLRVALDEEAPAKAAPARKRTARPKQT